MSLSRYTVKFHPVGQGLFSSGKLFFENGEEFNFIYDCGTSSKQRLLDNAISSLSKNVTIDLLTISHFDQDHISGLEKLLSRHKVKTLLMPYLSLKQRLFSAFFHNVGVSGKFMDFYRDPIKYLLLNYGDMIEQIILVPSGKKEIQDFKELNNNDHDFIIDADNYNGKTNVKIMKIGGRLVYKKIFEFIPYNDSEMMPKMNKIFSHAVKKERKTLLKSTTKTDINSSITKIKHIYDKNFGKSAVNRNIISLYLFAAPCKKNIYHVEVLTKNKFSFYCRTTSCNEGGILYTGDGYLNTNKRLNELLKFLGKDKVNRIVCMQVMHHGSKGSWHKGVAKAFSPCFSIFSSNPDHKSLKHPHGEVVRDFLPFSPMQVDQDNFFDAYFYL